MGMADEISRREFVKHAAVGAAILASTSGAGALIAVPAGPLDPNKRIVAALGAVFIPSKPGDPGYAELEPQGISDFVMEKLPVEALTIFNTNSQSFFDGKSFLDLSEKQREEYLALIADGHKLTDPEQKVHLQSFYRAARNRILSVYYKNFPLEEYKANAQGIPMTQPGDTHQITNPNVWKDKKIVTGWDIAGYKGTPSWEEEEKEREKEKKISAHWFEGATAKLDPARPPAAAATKTKDGHDYYDVIVLGGGTAGCIIAGRLAERGMNPKTGDKLRVALIEGGDDWTIRDPSLNPGYGGPIRRLMSAVPDERWDYPLAEGDANMKRLGGCALHYGGTLWMPQEEDFQFYRETSGVNWDMAKFGTSLQEVADLMYLTTTPDEWWSKGDHIWADGARKMGFEVRSNQRAFRNGFPGTGRGNRFDVKGNTLPWAYIGINHGLKIIANADVQKIMIDKVAGGRPVATGAVYKDKAGVMHEVRAARVIVAAGTIWGPMLCYRSGYGPKALLGDKLIVENKNVGENLSADCDYISSAYLSEPVNFTGRASDIPNETVWAATSPRPWKALHIRVHSGNPVTDPGTVALDNSYAPPFGWDHKEYMRNGSGVSRVMMWRCHLCAIPWTWRVRPDGFAERTSLDEPAFNAAVKQGSEFIRAWHDKLIVKPLKVDMRTFARHNEAVRPQHMTGTTRAGESAETSVCTSDFDCHDIDNLLFTGGSTIPKTFLWAAGPVAAGACYGYRRMIENHFSTGCSTKGFA
jgi:choline dehydrogenase-like flavoprotein